MAASCINRTRSEKLLTFQACQTKRNLVTSNEISNHVVCEYFVSSLCEERFVLQRVIVSQFILGQMVRSVSVVLCKPFHRLSQRALHVAAEKAETGLSCFVFSSFSLGLVSEVMFYVSSGLLNSARLLTHDLSPSV